MFTGIIEETGKISSYVKQGSSAIVRVECSKVLENTILGDSIAVNGVCLTATKLGSNFFEADISYETIERSSLKRMLVGHVVNLERALTLSSRLGGHIVQGHVDATATIQSVIKHGNSYVLKISYPNNLDKYITDKCSVTIDGISLTVAKTVNNILEVAVIPHTFENTNLKDKTSGDIINLEVDQIARYVEKLLKNENADARMLDLLNTL